MWKWRLRRIMLANEASWWNLLVWRAWSGLRNRSNFCLWDPKSGKYFFGIQNPSLFSLDSSKKKNPAKELNPYARSTDKESGLQNPRRRIQKTRLSSIPLDGPRPVANPGEGFEGPGPSPLIFRPNWGPKGRKNNFLYRPPSPYLRVWMNGSPFLWRSGSSTGDFGGQKSVLNLVNFEMFNSL